MRVLHVNKFLYRRGGAESYLLDVAALQRAAGHDVAFFGTRHPENDPALDDPGFPEYIELDPPPASWSRRARAAGRIIYSREAERALARQVERSRPDIVHLHNIYHHLSPSVLRPLRERGIPMVMTLHDFKLACPTHRFLAGGRVCEACLPRRFYMPTVKRCYQGSVGASTLNGLELAIHTLLRMYAPVHLFLCPSRFMLKKMTAGRVFPDRLRWLPNFVDAAAIEPKSAAGGGAVYVGRLSQEKGVAVLVEAAANLTCDVHIVGDGPDRHRLNERAKELGARRLSFHGHVPAEDVHQRLRNASVAVMPSIGYENAPMGILEAFAAGVPVIGTDHGGIPELIEKGVDGDLVPPGDAGALAASIDRFVTDPDRSFRLGTAARSKVATRFSPAGHLAALDDLYREAISLEARANP
jgi:glycosyltransferase involved in cell wall biosynthesis